MNPRFLLVAVLLSSIASSTLEAGYSFSFNAGPPPGQGGEYGNVFYSGPNQLSSNMNSVAPYYGITATGTPQNSGRTYSEATASFSINGQSGTFNIGSDFIGQVITSSVGATGGSFQIEGLFSASVASYYGISATQEEAGLVFIQLSTPALSGGAGGNKSGSIQFSVSPGAIPEPSSLILMGTGLLGVVVVLRRRSRSRP